MTGFVKRLTALTIALAALLPCGAFAAPGDGTAPASPAIATPTNAGDPRLPLAGFVIGIDPGHQAEADRRLELVSPEDDTSYKYRMSAGGTGTLSGVPEYEINRLVSMKLASLLRQAGASVVLTRTVNDVSLSNQERAAMMNEAGADLWVRIHCNSSVSSKSAGALMLLPSSGMDIYDESKRLGGLMLSSFCEATGAQPLAMAYTSTQTGFNWSDSPVVAIEMGFLSNPKEDLLLCRDSYQSMCANGIFDGILAYCAGDAQ